MLDGSPQGRTAWLSKPYLLPPEGKGADYVAVSFARDAADMNLARVLMQLANNDAIDFMRRMLPHFSPVVAMPWMKVFCAKKNSSNTGKMVTVLAAGIQIVAYMAKMREAADILTEEEIPAFCADVAKIAVAQHNAKVQGGGAPAQPGGGMTGMAAPQQQPQGA